MLGHLSLLWTLLVKSEEIASAKNRLSAYAQIVLSYFGSVKFIAEHLPLVERIGFALGHFIYVWVGLDEHAPPKEKGVKALRLGKMTLTHKGEKLVLKVWLVASKTVIKE